MSKLESYVASTTEVDDSEVAVQEILARIPLEKLKKNSVGIVACHYEFDFSGVLKSIAEALPFDVVGSVSSAQGTQGGAAVFELVLTVLTSDEAEIALALSDPLEGDTQEVVRTAYDEAAGKLGSRPDLILIHGPFMIQNNGDDYLTELSAASDNAPLFGTLAIDDTEDFRCCYSIHKGKTYNDRLVLTLLKGVEPRFYSAHIAPNKIVGDPALVTSSEGALLAEVNDRPIAEYLAGLGQTSLDDPDYALVTMPFVLDYGDGTAPISRIFIQLTPDGKAVLNGSVPVGSELVIGSFDKEDALETTQVAIDEALAQSASPVDGRPAVMLMYSCIARFLALGADYLAEIEQSQKQIGGKIPFMMAYSGGEYCPTELTKRGAVNRFHNNALVICVL